MKNFVCQVHGDIKLANLCWTNFKQLTLIDFDKARTRAEPKYSIPVNPEGKTEYQTKNDEKRDVAAIMFDVVYMLVSGLSKMEDHLSVKTPKANLLNRFYTTYCDCVFDANVDEIPFATELLKDMDEC